VNVTVVTNMQKGSIKNPEHGERRLFQHRKREPIRVATFSSKTGRWDVQDIYLIDEHSWWSTTPVEFEYMKYRRFHGLKFGKGKKDAKARR